MSARRVIIVRADQQARANAMLAQVAPDTDYAKTFDVPLYNASGVVVGYWCSWDFAATKRSLATLRSEAVKAGIPAGKIADLADPSGAALGSVAFVFDPEAIDTKAVLAKLGVSATNPKNPAVA